MKRKEKEQKTENRQSVAPREGKLRKNVNSKRLENTYTSLVLGIIGKREIAVRITKEKSLNVFYCLRIRGGVSRPVKNFPHIDIRCGYSFSLFFLRGGGGISSSFFYYLFLRFLRCILLSFLSFNVFESNLCVIEVVECIFFCVNSLLKLLHIFCFLLIIFFRFIHPLFPKFLNTLIFLFITPLLRNSFLKFMDIFVLSLTRKFCINSRSLLFITSFFKRNFCDLFIIYL